MFFVDHMAKPLQVTIDEQTSEPTTGYPTVSNLRESDQDGIIDIVCGARNDDNCCFLYAKGFAIDLVSTSFSRSRSMQVSMKPESDIQILLVDGKGKPISNARVSPGYIHFRKSAWLANVPHRLPESFESRTDAAGIAKLHGAIAEELKSVRISLDDERGCTFEIPARWDRASVLRVVWDAKFGTLTCRVLDPAGSPVAGAKLYANTNGEFVNSNVIREPTLNFVEYLGVTDKDGSITVANVPAIPLDVRLFSPEKSIGRGEFRKEFVVEAGKTNVLEFRQKSVSPCLVSIVDLTDSMNHEGIDICFRLIDRIDNITGVAKTNEDGLCEVEVQPGEWAFIIDESNLPPGYCVYHPERSFKFVVQQGNELQGPPPLYIGKGLQIQGKIVGIDLKELRNDWLGVVPKDSGWRWIGRLNEHGEFCVVVPNYISIDSIDDFQIADGNKGTLSVESKTPWVIKWTPRKDPPQ